MKAVVIDASATIAWAFNERDRAEVLDSLIPGLALVVPSIWRLEVVNAALVKERRRSTSPADSARVFELIEALGVEVCADRLDRPLRDLAQVARPHQITSYDAEYLGLAESRGLALLTTDNNLQDAARHLRVDLVLDRQRP